MAGYEFDRIEAKWQAYWAENQTFRQPNPGERGFADRPKCYVLDMFPYPSGAGLHVGHPEGYTATDIVARYKRMRGFNVLHPMGYDAFGLPAEQYAVEHGVHPRQTTAENIANIERQIKMFGFSYDWSRRLATTDVEYYRWTQWIFLRLYNSWYDEQANAARPIRELERRLLSGELVVDINGNLHPVSFLRRIPEISLMAPSLGDRKFTELEPDQRRRLLDEYRLAYMAEVPVNWCPQLGTVLANEEVTNEGRSDRGDFSVYRRALRQWMLRITAYAERLLTDLDLVDWPESIKLMQRNWIGRSEGAEVDFQVESPEESSVGGKAHAGCATDSTDEWFSGRRERGFPVQEEQETIRVYTTRPDTLYGATYMVLAPEHPLVEQITTPDRRAQVQAYVKQAANKSELERTAESKDKTGVFTGAHAVNPVNRQRIQVWVADYVMLGYGTGAIMAVPAHDERDFQFAKAHGLPIVTVVLPGHETALRVPISTSYYFKGEPTRGVSPNEWRAIADSIRDQFRRNSVFYSSAPHGYVRFLAQNGETIGVVANDDLVRLHDMLDEDTFAEFSRHLRERSDEERESFTGDGTAVNSGEYNGLPTAEFKKKITEDLAQAGLGKAAVKYKLRDWLFSRQRYWGEPFPIVHCPKCGTLALPEDRLPLELPDMDDFTPAASDDPEALPQPPLAKAADWVNTTCPSCGGRAQRETNTMPQWAGSCWYYLRYLDPNNTNAFCNAKVEKYWMKPAGARPAGGGGVDLYVGGAEHAVLHLLYARFWHKVLFDLGFVSTPEPFAKLFNQGMIRSFAYRDRRGVYVAYEDVDLSGDKPRHKTTGEELSESVEKMSKSLKNVVNPDEVIRQYGADTFRLYEMFMGPLEASKPWNTRDVPGVHRFLQRVWRMIAGGDDHPALVCSTGVPPVSSMGVPPMSSGSGEEPKNMGETPMLQEVERALARLIQKVGQDIEAMKFNTPIAAMMEFVNGVYKAGSISPSQAERFVLVLAPFAPHLAEELWQKLGHKQTLAREAWPVYDPALLAEETVELAVQVNGRMRGRITVPADADEEAIVAAALADPKVAPAVAGKTVLKKIVVPKRLVNLVVK